MIICLDIVAELRAAAAANPTLAELVPLRKTVDGADLLAMYGVGWQVNTPSPDDVVLEQMVGMDEEPAIPGYDPDISAELCTTNGDTDTHMTVVHGTLGFTPEMTTCEVASAKYDDQWLPEDCISGFNFPDDDRLILEELETGGERYGDAHDDYYAERHGHRHPRRRLRGGVVDRCQAGRRPGRDRPVHLPGRARHGGTS